MNTLQVAPHKPRDLFVKLIDFNPRLKKPFSFLALAFSKVQRFDGGLHFFDGLHFFLTGAPRVSSSGNRQLDKNQPAANFDAG